MSIKDLLEFRDLNIEAGVDSLKDDLELFFELTYPSQLIKELIQFINNNIKNNKMSYRDDEGAVIIRGSRAMGKTHALLTAYNLFANYDLAIEWLNEHDIKFNKFNALVLKNKTKSSLASLNSRRIEKSWIPIFAGLGAKDLLTADRERPSLTALRKLTKAGNIAIFIDDLASLFARLQRQKKEELIKQNREFIAELLTEASNNENLMLFITVGREEEELEEIFAQNEVISKETETLGQRAEFMAYHIFDLIKDQQFRTNIDTVLDSYLEVYEKAGFEIDERGEFKESLISSYPFQTELLEVLRELYQSYGEEIEDYNSELDILADLSKQYQDEDMLVVSDLSADIFKGVYPELYNGLQEELQQLDSAGKDYAKSLVAAIFLYSIIDSKEATKENLLKGVLRPGMEEELNSLEKELAELIKDGEQVALSEGVYQLQEKRSFRAQIEERKEEVSATEKEARIQEYITKSIFDGNYKLYGRDEIEDKPELEYVLLLDAPQGERLNELLKEQYEELRYENSFIFITPTEDIFSEEVCTLVSEVIALERVINSEQERVKELEEKHQEAETRLKQVLRNSFGDYLQWVEKDGETKLEKVNFSSTEIEALRDAIINKGAIKDYILDRDELVIELNKLWEESKLDRRLPVIPNQDILNRAAEELEEDGKIQIDDQTQQIYYELLISIEEEMSNLEDETVKERLDYFIRDNLFDENYKIWGYEEVEDRVELDYLLFLEQPSGEWKEFLEQEVYQNLEFQNSTALLRAKEEIYTPQVLEKMRKIIAVNNLAEQREIDQGGKILAVTAEKLSDLLNDKFGYYAVWEGSKEDLQLEEKEVSIHNLDSDLEVALEELKKDLISNLRGRKFGIDIEELFLDYRRFRDYPLILDKDLFDRAVEELIEEEKIINAEEANKVYGNTSALIKSTVAAVEDEEIKEELVFYIKEELFDSNYDVFDYDEVVEDGELNCLLLFADFRDEEELGDYLEDKLDQQPEAKHNLVFYSPQEDILQDRYLNQMKLVIGVKRAQEKINWEEGQINRILDRRREQLTKELQDVFGDYFYWEREGAELKLQREEVDLEDIEDMIATTAAKGRVRTEVAVTEEERENTEEEREEEREENTEKDKEDKEDKEDKGQDIEQDAEEDKGQDIEQNIEQNIEQDIEQKTEKDVEEDTEEDTKQETEEEELEILDLFL